MQFSINPEVFSNLPQLTIGVIHVQNLNNSATSASTTDLLRSSEATTRNALNLETYREQPYLAAMQAAHRSFGSNPNKYPPSIQALVKRVIKGGNLPSISPLVDVYNAMSLKHTICIGAEDLTSCQGTIELTYADGNEEFTLIGSTESEPPEPGELIYKDDAGAICRKLNWREAGRTCVTEQTTEAIVVLEALPPYNDKTVESILSELQMLIKEYCSGNCTPYLLNPDHSTIDL